MENVYRKSPDMLMLEQLFTNLKIKEDMVQSLKGIERILARQFDLDFDISITDNKTNEFFGMSIYPSRTLIDAMVDAMLNKKSNSAVIEDLWTKNKIWHLDIDSILLHDPGLNVNPAEMVAILLHEIGHIVFSNTVPQRLNKVVRYELMHVSYKLKKLLTWTKAQKLFDLVLIEACSSKNFNSSLRREVAADKFVVKMGYGNNLEQFIAKLLTTQGNGLVDRSEKDMERDIRSVVTWSLDNINELEYRKTKLRTLLQTEIFRNPSKYVRGVVYDIKAVFFGGADEDSYKEILAEQYLVQEHARIVKEGFFNIFDKVGKIKKVSQSDIDIIEVEKERISNSDDKIYVLDLIYDKLDQINISLDLIDRKDTSKVSQSKDTLIKFKNQLEKIRKETLDVRIKDKQYGVFIQYPKGYEG